MWGVTSAGRFRQVWYDSLVRRLRSRGHTDHASAWAVHQLEVDGLLGTDVFVGGYDPPPSNYFRGRVTRTGPPGLTNRGQGPDPRPCIRIWSTGKLWEWDDKNKMAHGKRQPGDRVAGWLLKRRLGRGGNGEVWLATAEDGSTAAVKFLHAQHQHPRNRRFKRFKQEVALHQWHFEIPQSVWRPSNQTCGGSTSDSAIISDSTTA
jgi:hypothetical protein